MLFLAVPASSDCAATALGQVGDWQVSLEQGTSGLSGEQCVISTVSEVEGGRRERPQIRIIPADRQIVIDPDRYLSGVIAAVAALEHLSERTQPQRTLEHRVRIDAGEIIKATEEDPRFGELAVKKDPAAFAQILQSLSAGRVLRYEWALDRGSKSYEYSLDGFAAMRELVRENPACQVEGS